MKDRWQLFSVYIAMVTLAFTSALWADYSIRENGRKFCDIITTVNEAYQNGPEPTTDLGKDLKRKYAELEKRLDCE